jgi:excisionase family DNA binding protein
VRPAYFLIFLLWHTAVMEKLISKFVSLGFVSQETGLPQSYIKKLAKENKIPALLVSGRWRFNFEAVEKALADIAAKGGNNE